MQTRFRSVFISDVHLGTKACQALHLLDFCKTLRQTRCTWLATLSTYKKCVIARILLNLTITS